MKVLIVILAIVAGGWYWMKGSKSISEADVHAHYSAQIQALADRDTKKMCAAFDDGFSGSGTTVSAAGRVNESVDKAKACASLEEFFASAKKLEAQMPGGFQIDTEQHVQSIEISPDKKKATVAVKSVMKLGNPQMLLMKFTNEQTDTFVRKNGQLKLVAQTGKTVVE